MNKMAIHTHVIFRPRNAMFFLLNTYVFPVGMYCHFIHFLFNNFINKIKKIVHFCYFQNTFHFASTFRQTDYIRKNVENISWNRV